jgi:hypothetical protein
LFDLTVNSLPDGSIGYAINLTTNGFSTGYVCLKAVSHSNRSGSGAGSPDLRCKLDAAIHIWDRWSVNFAA